MKNIKRKTDTLTLMICSLAAIYFSKIILNYYAKYQQRFQYFLVDEFQDINKVQYELIKILS